MIRKDDLIAVFERMLREKWPYEWGAAKEGLVDCSGAFVYAYKLFGESIYHGSNTMAREHVGALRPVSEAKPGWAVFKVRAWTESERNNRWYGTEPGDVYHVGLMGNDGTVLNAKSTKEGFVASELSENWAYAAKLDEVIYKEDETMQAYQARVVLTRPELPNNGLVIRTEPGGDDEIAKLGHGSIVTVQAVSGKWAFVTQESGPGGYVNAKYLQRIEDDEEDSPDMDGGETESAGEDDNVPGNLQMVVIDEEGAEFYPTGRITVEMRAVTD